MLSKDWLNTTAPVGQLGNNNEWIAFGACVVFHQPPVLWMVTANHVVSKIGRRELTVLVTSSAQDGVMVVEVGKILNNHGISWIQDKNNDLAAAPLPTSPGFAIKAVTEKNCLPIDRVVPSMPCFTVGCPYGLRGLDPQRSTPLVLDGIVSGVDMTKGHIYTSAPTFPGNSGGPLIAVRTPFNPMGGMNIGTPTIYFAGIMLETKLLQPKMSENDSIQTPPLHLGLAISADSVLKLLSSPDAKEVANKITANSTTENAKVDPF